MAVRSRRRIQTGMKTIELVKAVEQSDRRCGEVEVSSNIKTIFANSFHTPQQAGSDTNIENLVGDSGTVTTSRKSVFCDVCQEHSPAHLIIFCENNHTLCKDDIEHKYRDAITQGQGLPPVCCQQNKLPIRKSIQLLSEETASAYLKHIENLEKTQTHKRARTGLAESEKFLVLAKREGWQVCPNCRRWIQKTEGCDDMLCHCGEHFYYKCGAVKGRCHCAERATRIAAVAASNRTYRSIPETIVNAGPRHGFRLRPSDCSHQSEPWTRITQQTRTQCCTHDNQQLRCNACGMQVCYACKRWLSVNTA